MEIVLNRKGGVPVRDQLQAQLELRILAGEIAAGERLPSVRALARRLRLHPNTVSAAYRRLESAGHVEMRKGAGVFVSTVGATSLESAQDLDEMIQVALAAARRKGFSAADVRAAVERWLGAAPPARIVTVDRSLAMAELLAAEVRAAVTLPVEAHGLQEVQESPALLDGALTVSLPYHVAALRRASPRAALFTVTLEVLAPFREAILALPKGAIALVVSHSETVLPFASTLIRSLRGDEVLVEARTQADGRGWRRLLPAADVVIADVLAAEVVSRSRPRRLQAMQVLDGEELQRLAAAARSASAAVASATSASATATRAARAPSARTARAASATTARGASKPAPRRGKATRRARSR
jgi:DNA-binding transcriptional regulator YhcF (GntR family)